MAVVQLAIYIRPLQKVFELSFLSRNNFCLAIEKYKENPGRYGDERIGIFLVMGRKGFDVAKFREAASKNQQLSGLSLFKNTKFKSFPTDTCDDVMNPQNTKTAYIYME